MVKKKDQKNLVKKHRKDGKPSRFIHGGGILSLQIAFASIILLILKISPAVQDWLSRVNSWVLILAFLIFLIKPVHQFLQKRYI
ncbi:hypothetical protein HN604_02640 [archaeon]|jgi:hypothetical protein|nr:hypothetical protein [archaeon]MBT6182556.1 hypothetical protein [archaeon]MBT6606067.1 hypothetical protein [archaeon]MBT7252093.1 hypothetical protein [archaeon]MBT7660958.1 hypothetical protein [archaeon]